MFLELGKADSGPRLDKQNYNTSYFKVLIKYSLPIHT